jgi:outer membrane biosynthesis protein TonB
MGVPMPEMVPVENASAEALLSSLKTIGPGERRKHASVFNSWLSIRGARQFPPIRDLDPLEISDAGPWSILLEMIGGGEDAVVRHFGLAIRGDCEVEKIGEAPGQSLLACIHAKLPIVAACREAFAFEDAFDPGQGKRRCWVTLLPFSGNGTWIDFVYAYVSLEGEDETVEAVAEAPEEDPVEEVAQIPEEEPVAEDLAETAEEEPAVEDGPAPEPEPEPEPFQVELKPYDEQTEDAPEPASMVEPEPEPEVELPPEPEPIAEFEPEPVEDSEDGRPSFTAKFMESVSGFYEKVVQTGPELPAEAFVEEQPIEPAQPVRAMEGSLNSQLTDVRALAEEARQAQIRSNQALYQGLSAAYDFALDAEGAPEEYLKLVEAQGLKIQLRSPMKPVVRLAFDGTCDEPTIAQLEAVLAWALKQDLPRGSLVERIEAEGGIGQILSAAAS